MNGIEKITAKIQQDAEAEVQALMAQTEEKVAAIQAQANAQAKSADKTSEAVKAAVVARRVAGR